MTFHIDPAAAEQVTAMTDTGVSLVTHRPANFTAGTAPERVVGDSAALTSAAFPIRAIRAWTRLWRSWATPLSGAAAISARPDVRCEMTTAVMTSISLAIPHTPIRTPEPVDCRGIGRLPWTPCTLRRILPGVAGTNFGSAGRGFESLRAGHKTHPRRHG
jgi:hypothetical protein